MSSEFAASDIECEPTSSTRDSGSDEEIDAGQKKLLTEAQEHLIRKLEFFQEQYESPTEEDLEKLTDFPLGDSEEDCRKRFKHVTEITVLTVQLIAEFSKRVPGFDTISREDQFTLLKACVNEVMVLRTARKYDKETDSIVHANHQVFTREDYRNAGMGDSTDPIFDFYRTMSILKIDNAEYALLTAIVIFSERPSLLEPRKVEKIREFYMETLQSYMATSRPPGENCFARLLATLVALRTIGSMDSELSIEIKDQDILLHTFPENIRYMMD